MRQPVLAPRTDGLVGVSQGSELAGVEEEGVAGCVRVQFLDLPDDDPVVAGRVFGDDFAFERGECVGEERYAAAPGFPVEAGEAIGVGGGGALWRTPRVAVRGC